MMRIIRDDDARHPMMTEEPAATPRHGKGPTGTEAGRMPPVGARPSPTLTRRMRRGRIACPHPLASRVGLSRARERRLRPHLRHELRVEVALDRLGAALAAVARILRSAKRHL